MTDQQRIKFKTKSIAYIEDHVTGELVTKWTCEVKIQKEEWDVPRVISFHQQKIDVAEEITLLNQKNEINVRNHWCMWWTQLLQNDSIIILAILFWLRLIDRQ